MKKSLLLLSVVATAPVALLLPGCSGGTAGLGSIFPTPTPATSTATPVPSATITATPRATAMPVASATPVTVNGQRFVAQFSGASGYNGSAATFDVPQLASSYLGTFVTPTFDNSGAAVPRTVQFTIVTTTGTVAPGTYPVVARVVGTNKQAAAFYNEGPTKGWEGIGGQIIVDSVSGDVFRFRFVGVQMTFGRRFGSTTSQGTFTLNGSGSARASCFNVAGCA